MEKRNISQKKQEILKKYGLNVTLEEASNIKIIDTYVSSQSSFKSITFVNQSTGEKIAFYSGIPTDDTMDYNITITFNNEEIDYNSKVKKDYLKLDDLKGEVVRKRAWANVDTKYGKFCFCLEEDNFKKTVQLFSSNYDDIWEPLSSYEESTIFAITYDKAQNMHNLLLGNRPSTLDFFPTKEINLYEVDNSSIYTYSSRNYCHDEGVILLNGQLTPENNETLKKIAESLKTADSYYEVREAADTQHTSKIYFGNLNDQIQIFKDDDQIHIIYKSQRPLGFLIPVFDFCIFSENMGQLTRDDFEKIIIALHNTALFDNYQNQRIITELINYINTHEKDNLNIQSKSLKNVTYDYLLNIMQNGDIALLVENLIDEIKDTFNIPMDELLGTNQQVERRLGDFVRYMK